MTLTLVTTHVTIPALDTGGALPRHVMTLLPCHAVTLRVTVTPPAASAAALTAVYPQVSGSTLTRPRHGLTHPCHEIISMVSVTSQSEAVLTNQRPVVTHLRVHSHTGDHTQAPRCPSDSPLCRTEPH